MVAKTNLEEELHPQSLRERKAREKAKEKEKTKAKTREREMVKTKDEGKTEASPCASFKACFKVLPPGNLPNPIHEPRSAAPEALSKALKFKPKLKKKRLNSICLIHIIF